MTTNYEPLATVCPICNKKLKTTGITTSCVNSLDNTISTNKSHYTIYNCINVNNIGSIFNRFEECIISADDKYHVINFIHFNQSIKNYSDIGYFPNGSTNAQYSSIEDIDKVFRYTNKISWEKEVKEFYQNYLLLE